MIIIIFIESDVDCDVEPRLMPDVLPPAIPPKKKDLIEKAILIPNPLELSFPFNSPSLSTSCPQPSLPPKPMNHNRFVISNIIVTMIIMHES